VTEMGNYVFYADTDDRVQEAMEFLMNGEEAA